jgi:hypothetical protein
MHRSDASGCPSKILDLQIVVPAESELLNYQEALSGAGIGPNDGDPPVL